jgi:hypothetical protein
MIKAMLAACALLAGSAHADKHPKPSAKTKAVTGRVVDITVRDDARIVTVLVGSKQGVGKTWRAKFREGTTTKPLEGGDAVLIRVDKLTSVLKTTLTTEQIRANRTIQLDP